MWRSHAAHELTWTAYGAAEVELAAGRYPVDAQWGLWLPAGTSHQVHAGEDSLLLPLWFDAQDFDAWCDEPTPVLRTPEVDRMVRAALQPGLQPYGREGATMTAVHAVVGALLREDGTTPIPRSRPAREVAIALLRDPRRGDSVEQWARQVHVSAKTLQRAFVSDTGLPFSRWRTKVRLSAAVSMLRSGDSVSRTSAQVGFRSPSAFAAACRAELAMTPGQVRSAATVPSCFEGGASRLSAEASAVRRPVG